MSDIVTPDNIDCVIDRLKEKAAALGRKAKPKSISQGSVITVPLCADCGSLVEHFIVHDAVWLSVCQRMELVCRFCVETRLGRALVLSDYKACLCNLNVFIGYRMAITSPPQVSR